jgi:hypothetical protein
MPLCFLLARPKRSIPGVRARPPKLLRASACRCCCAAAHWCAFSLQQQQQQQQDLYGEDVTVQHTQTSACFLVPLLLGSRPLVHSPCQGSSSSSSRVAAAAAVEQQQQQQQQQ